MSIGSATVLPYLHPVVGGLIIVFLGYIGSLGLRARNDRHNARTYLARHARWGPMMYLLVLASWAGGLLSTRLLRHDLDVAASTHFRIGLFMVLALSGGFISSRWMDRSQVRELHPWLGAAAMLLAAAQVFFGLQITP